MTPTLEKPLDLLLLTADPNPDSVLPSLSLLAHTVRCAPSEVSSLLDAGAADVALVDARHHLAAARGLRGTSAAMRSRRGWRKRQAAAGRERRGARAPSWRA